MIRIFGPKGSQRDEEEKKEEEKNGPGGAKKRSAGEIRLQKELAELDLPKNVVIDFPRENDIMNFDIRLTVDDSSSMWYPATYHFTFTVPVAYPHEPPRVHCNTKIYHPNINLQGNVCLNILRADWKPVLCINAVILGLNFLFLEPNPNDPLNQEAAQLMRENPSRFADIVYRSLRGQTVNGETYPRLL
jgi:ubiquitin-conjugating enzyme E2 M